MFDQSLFACIPYSGEVEELLVNFSVVAIIETNKLAWSLVPSGPQTCKADKIINTFNLLTMHQIVKTFNLCTMDTTLN